MERRNRSTGFTVLEAMVAVAIASGILVVGVKIFQRAYSLHFSTKAESSSHTEMDLLLRQMTKYYSLRDIEKPFPAADGDWEILWVTNNGCETPFTGVTSCRDTTFSYREAGVAKTRRFVTRCQAPPGATLLLAQTNSVQAAAIGALCINGGCPAGELPVVDEYANGVLTTTHPVRRANSSISAVGLALCSTIIRTRMSTSIWPHRVTQTVGGVVTVRNVVPYSREVQIFMDAGFRDLNAGIRMKRANKVYSEASPARRLYSN